MSDVLRFDVETVARQIGQLVAHPQYQALIDELERAPEHERENLARRIATRDGLLQRGIELPKGFRLTLRWFEDPDTSWPVKEVSDEAAMPALAGWSVCGSVGFVVCASVGYAK